LGGSQPTQSNGLPGRSAGAGRPGPDGENGGAGVYTFTRVSTFDPIVAKLRAHPNEELNRVLAQP